MSCRHKVQKRWFPRPRFVRSRSAGSPLTVMYKWCQPSRLQYGSRAPDHEGTGLVRELFFQFGIFARETPPSAFKQYKIQGNASNLVQSHFESPPLKELESGIAPLIPRGFNSACWGLIQLPPSRFLVPTTSSLTLTVGSKNPIGAARAFFKT